MCINRGDEIVILYVFARIRQAVQIEIFVKGKSISNRSTSKRHPSDFTVYVLT